MKTYAFLIIGVVAISFAAIFIRLAEAPSLVIAAYRLAIAVVLLLPFTFRESIMTIRKTKRRDLMLMILSGIFIALHFWLWITSLEYTSIASSVVLVTSHPAFVALLSYLLWKQKLTKQVVTGIIVVVIGIIIMNAGSLDFGSQVLSGNALALAAGFAMGGYLVIGHHLRGKTGFMSYITIVYSVSAVIILLANIISGYSLIGYSADTYIMLLLLAIVPQLIGHSSLNLAVRRLPAIIVSIAILGEPVGATILGMAILGETPAIAELIGGVIIISGIIYVIRRNRQIASITVGSK